MKQRQGPSGKMAIDGQPKPSKVKRPANGVRGKSKGLKALLLSWVRGRPSAQGRQEYRLPEPPDVDPLGTPKKFGLVLPGGGALGAYEVGAIQYLYDCGMQCAIVSGASSGAMNAVTLAGAKGYPPAALRALWEKLIVEAPLPLISPAAWAIFGSANMYTPRRDFWNFASWTSFCDTTPLKRTLEELLDWERVHDSERMRVIVSASGVETGETAYFSNFDREPLSVEHVLASGSLPPGFPWTIIDKQAYWDGGLTDNTPLKPVIDNLHGNEPASMPIFIINVFSSSATLPSNLRQVIQRMFELLLQNKLKADSETAHRYARFIRILRKVDAQLPPEASVRQDEDWQAVMNYGLLRELRMIDIKKPDKDSAADFSRETILRRITAGYDATKASLAETPLKGESSVLRSPERS